MHSFDTVLWCVPMLDFFNASKIWTLNYVVCSLYCTPSPNIQHVIHNEENIWCFFVSKQNFYDNNLLVQCICHHTIDANVNNKYKSKFLTYYFVGSVLLHPCWMNMICFEHNYDYDTLPGFRGTNTCHELLHDHNVRRERETR